MTVFLTPKGDHASPTRGAGRKLALFSVKAEIADEGLRDDDAVGIERVVRSAAVHFVVTVGGLAAETDAQFQRWT